MEEKFNCHRFKTGYLDESGDNGKKGTKYLILTYVCTSDNKKIAKILKKTKDELKRSKKGERWLNRNGGELKFNSFPDDAILCKTLKQLSKLNLDIKVIAIKKNGKDVDSNQKVEILGDLLVQSLSDHSDFPYKIIADKDYFNDKKIAYFLVRNYEEIGYNGEGKEKKFSCDLYLIDKEVFDKYSDSELIISIRHENSRGNIELQATDLICGAIAQEFEKENKGYTDILKENLKIKGRVKEQKWEFKK